MSLTAMEKETNPASPEPTTTSPSDEEMEEGTADVYDAQPLNPPTTRRHSSASLNSILERRGTWGFHGLLFNHGYKCASADAISRFLANRTAEDRKAGFVRTSASKRLRLSPPDCASCLGSSCSISPHDQKSETLARNELTLDQSTSGLPRKLRDQDSTRASSRKVREASGELRRISEECRTLKHRSKRRKRPWLSLVDWSYLPDVALVAIYRCLDNASQVNMSSVCRHWRSVFFSAELWRTSVLCPTSKCFLFSRLLGRHVRDLTLVCGETWSPSVFKSMLENLKAARLVALEFTDLTFGLDEWPLKKPDLIAALAGFLKTQSHLAVVRFGQAELTLEDACKLLNALPITLTELGVEVLLATPSTNVPVFEDSTFWNSLQRFENLRELRIAYDCINDDQLLQLSSSIMGRQLCKLSLHVYEDTPRRHVLQATTWRELTSQNPSLRVRVHAEDVDEEGLRRVLSWGMPVETLELMYTGDTEPDNEALGASAVLTHAAAHYPQLVEIALDDTSGQSVDEGLERVLECCKGLQVFKFSGTLTKEGMENIFSLMALDTFKATEVHLDLNESEDAILLRDLVGWLQIVKPGLGNFVVRHNSQLL